LCCFVCWGFLFFFFCTVFRVYLFAVGWWLVQNHRPFFLASSSLLLFLVSFSPEKRFSVPSPLITYFLSSILGIFYHRGMCVLFNFTAQYSTSSLLSYQGTSRELQRSFLLKPRGGRSAFVDSLMVLEQVTGWFLLIPFLLN